MPSKLQLDGEFWEAPVHKVCQGREEHTQQEKHLHESGTALPFPFLFSKGQVWPTVEGAESTINTGAHCPSSPGSDRQLLQDSGTAVLKLALGCFTQTETQVQQQQLLVSEGWMQRAQNCQKTAGRGLRTLPQEPRTSQVPPCCTAHSCFSGDRVL